MKYSANQKDTRLHRADITPIKRSALFKGDNHTISMSRSQSIDTVKDILPEIKEDMTERSRTESGEIRKFTATAFAEGILAWHMKMLCFQ